MPALWLYSGDEIQVQEGRRLLPVVIIEHIKRVSGAMEERQALEGGSHWAGSFLVPQTMP